MDRELVSDLFDDILGSAPVEIVLRQADKLRRAERAALLEALRHVEDEAEACAGLGLRIRTIAGLIEAGPDQIVRFTFRFD